MLNRMETKDAVVEARPWDDILDDELKVLLANRQPRALLARRPALIAVDLYDLVYDGGPRPVTELMEQYPASCGEHAWAALPATVSSSRRRER